MNRPYNGIDTATKITAKAAKILREEGFSFVARYLVPNSGGTAWKALTAAEAADIRAAGLAIMPIWETMASRVKGGAKAGAEDGAKARQLAEEIGVPEWTAIYFAADYSVPATDFKTVEQYLWAVKESIGNYNVGLYGPEGVVRDQGAGGLLYLWQCVAWSSLFSDYANVIQYAGQDWIEAKTLAALIDTQVDLDKAASLDGMWMPSQSASPTAPPAGEPSIEAEDAHKWCIDMGVSDDTMRDVSQTELMFYRYHKLTAPDDYKTASGLLTD